MEKYLVIDIEGYELFRTDDGAEVVKEVYENKDAVVLVLGTDGDYHVDESDW